MGITMLKNTIILCTLFIASGARAEYLASAECNSDTYFSHIDKEKKTGIPFAEGADTKSSVLFTERYYLFKRTSLLIDDNIHKGGLRIAFKKGSKKNDVVFIDKLLDEGIVINGNKYKVLTPEEISALIKVIEIDFRQRSGLPSMSSSLINKFELLPGLKKSYQLGTEPCGGGGMCKRITLGGDYNEDGEIGTITGSIILDLAKTNSDPDTPWGKLVKSKVVTEQLYIDEVGTNLKLHLIEYKHNNFGCESRKIDESEFNIDVTKMTKMP